MVLGRSGNRLCEVIGNGRFGEIEGVSERDVILLVYL